MTVWCVFITERSERCEFNGTKLKRQELKIYCFKVFVLHRKYIVLFDRTL